MRVTIALATALILCLAAVTFSQPPPAATPHVRVIVNNTCGSGTICGSTEKGSWILTNAHVAGTALGRTLKIDYVSADGDKQTTAITRHSGYSATRMVDYAIAFADGLQCESPMKLLRTEPKQPPFATKGSPRCVWPQVLKPFDDPRSYGQDLITGVPNAIGGQSGSGIYNEERNTIALLTWTINGRCAGQKTQKIWDIATTGNTELAGERPAGLAELQELPSRPETENVIQSSMVESVRDLPIWFQVTPDAPDTPNPAPGWDWETILDWIKRIIALLDTLR